MTPAYNEQRSDELIAKQQKLAAVRHGVNCPKVAHFDFTDSHGHLHEPDDDTPYDVDGCSYCGRCHQAL